MTKKVLFIHHGGLAGGAPLSLLYTALGVAKNGYVPEVALLRPSPALHALYNDHGIVTHEVPYVPFFIVASAYSPPTFSFSTARDVLKSALKWKYSQYRLRRLLARNRFDLVHLNSAALSSVAQVLLRMGFPFVWHIREQAPARKGRRYRYIRNLIAQSPHVIFLSEAERESWEMERHGSVVHNFVDFDVFDAGQVGSRHSDRKRLNIQEDDFVILYLGGIKAHKGIEVLLGAVSRLTADHGEIKLLMPDSMIPADPFIKRTVKRLIGRLRGGEFFGARIESLIADLNLQDHCIRLPFDPATVPFFMASDLLVFPATQPHFARPIIEAAAMKLPVIASDFPVMRELIDDQETGYLIDAADVSAFAACIERFITSPALRQSMGERAYATARRKFCAEIQTKKILDIYSNALAANGYA